MPIEPDDADLPVHLEPPTILNLKAEDISTVVWATGYTGDFSWLPGSLLDARPGSPGRPGSTLPARACGTSGCVG